MLIRQAKIEDAEVVTRLAWQTFWDAFHAHPKNAPQDTADYMAKAFSLEQMTKELSDPKTIFLIAEIDNKPAGYAKLVQDNTETGITAERPVELNRLYSHQEFLGKGVGAALMDKCFEVAKDRGHDVMWLGVWEYNPRAQAFYLKNGFREVGKHTFMLGSDPQTDLLMQKEM